MPAIEFIIDNFDTEITLDLSGQLEKAFDTIDASATAVLYVDTSCVINAFKIQSDASDVVNALDTDIKYFVDRHAFWNADSSYSFAINAADAVLDLSAMLIGVNNNKNMVCHDFTRYLADELFNTVYGVDLFNNELELLTNIREKAKDVWGKIDTELIKWDINDISTPSNLQPINDDAVSIDYSGVSQTPTDTYIQGSTYRYYKNDSGNNITKKLLEQMAYHAPSRFSNFMNNNGLIQSLPFQDGDTISLKLTINPAPGQHNLTDLQNPIGARTFRIKYQLRDGFKTSRTGQVDRELSTSGLEENNDFRNFNPVPFNGAVSLP